MKKLIANILILVAIVASSLMAQDTPSEATDFRMIDKENNKYTTFPVDTVAFRWEMMRDSTLIAQLLALQLTDSARVELLVALQLSDSARIATLEALELTDSANVALARDSIQTLATLLGYAEGLRLDLDYYFNRNVVQFMADLGRDAASGYTGWTNFSAGVHADDVTNYKTDAQSIQITIPNGGALDGAYLDITDYDFTHFADGDTSVMADYINISVYILTQDITDLGSSDIGIFFCTDSPTTRTNYFCYLMKSELSNGWNYLQIAKSAFSGIGTCAGDSMWNSIDYILVINQNVVTDAEVVFSFDNIQMVRKAVAGAYPNPFQREMANGTWYDEWLQTGNHNVWLVEESGRLGVMAPDDNSSFLTSAASFVDLNASGKIKLGDLTGGFGHLFIMQGTANQSGYIYQNNLGNKNTAGGTVSTSFTAAVGDEVYWEASKRGTAASISASHTGVSGDWTTATSQPWTGTAQTVKIYCGYGQRHYSFGISTVQNAAYADMAGRLKGIGLKIVKDSLWVQRGDSTAHILVDFFYNP